MSNFIQVTPFMHVDNLDRALTFFTEILGFKTVHSQRGYAYVHRETVGFRIMQNQGTDGAPPGNRRFAKRFLADGRQYGRNVPNSWRLALARIAPKTQK